MRSDGRFISSSDDARLSLVLSFTPQPSCGGHAGSSSHPDGGTVDIRLASVPRNHKPDTTDIVQGIKSSLTLWCLPVKHIFIFSLLPLTPPPPPSPNSGSYLKAGNMWAPSKCGNIWRERLWELSVSSSLDIFDLGLGPPVERVERGWFGWWGGIQMAEQRRDQSSTMHFPLLQHANRCDLVW